MTRSFWSALFFLALGNFAVGTSGFLVVGILPQLTEGLGVSQTQGSLLFTIYAAAYAIGSPLLISYTGGIGRWRILLGAIVTVLLATLVCALTRSFEVMLAARILAALGGGVFTPVAASVVYAVTPVEGRGRALGLVFAGLQLSQAAGLPLGVLTANHLDWPMAFALLAALSAVATVGLARTLPRKVQVPVTSLRTLLDSARDPRILVAVGVMALHQCAMMVSYAFIAPLILRHGGDVGPSVAFFGVGGVISGLLMARLSGRLGAVRTRMITLVSQVLTLPILSLPLLGIAPLPGAVLLILPFVWHLFAGGLTIPQQIILMNRNPERGAVVLGLNATFNYLGIAAGAAVGGVVLRGPGLDWLGAVGAVIAALAVLTAIYSETLYRRDALAA
ncbi:MFS transporter [Pontitalea aquivivens]|uniref:MFS transporter n=1 Tax=Pontitalea aquivivens TaxID=3388663 RepID=UPI00397063AF